jgi:hypothetical protein
LIRKAVVTLSLQILLFGLRHAERPTWLNSLNPTIPLYLTPFRREKQGLQA